jgi:hypothetical protein
MEMAVPEFPALQGKKGCRHVDTRAQEQGCLHAET